MFVAHRPGRAVLRKSRRTECSPRPPATSNRVGGHRPHELRRRISLQNPETTESMLRLSQGGWVGSMTNWASQPAGYPEHVNA